VSDPIKYPQLNEPIKLKRPRWLNKKFFWFVCIWYLLSPKIGTISFWYSMKPDSYTLAVTRVYGAHTEPNSDVVVCVDLTNANDLKVQERVAIRLPVSKYLSGENAELNKWTNSVADSSTDTFAVPIHPEGSACAANVGALKVVKVNSLRPGQAALTWLQYSEELANVNDLVVVDVTSADEFIFDNTTGRTFGYLSRKIDRQIYEMEYAGSTENGDSIKRKVLRRERDLEFYFPLRQSGIHWENIGRIRWVLYDIVGGPLAWLGIFTPIITGRS